MKTFHLVHRDFHWVLEAEKPDDEGVVFVTHTTKTKALKVAVGFCKDYYRDNKVPVSLRIHKMNGVLQSERTYPRSADPRRSKG